MESICRKKMFIIGMHSIFAAACGLLSFVFIISAGNTDEVCHDNPYYLYQGKYCKEIAAKAFCNVELGNGNIIGKVHCPVSCDKCFKKYEESFLMVSKDCNDYGESIEGQ
jgi:hypothetical protein